MKHLLVATGNHHKTEEIRAILGEGWDVEDLRAHPDLREPEESGATFESNAQIKALAASRALPAMLVLADDSGLEVDALDGAPGVKSSRYAGTRATDADNRARLIRELHTLVRRGAPLPFAGRFRCCMCLAREGRVLGVFEGSVEGRLLLGEDGAGGFGYDPLFVPEGCDRSFGALPAETKNGMSHRARALAKVRDWLRENPDA